MPLQNHFFLSCDGCFFQFNFNIKINLYKERNKAATKILGALIKTIIPLIKMYNIEMSMHSTAAVQYSRFS